jgi:hypothetical protein
MPWSFIVPAAVSLFAGSQQKQAASQAADTTAAAADRSAALQYQMFQEQQKLQEPWRQAGINALGKLQSASDYTPFGMAQFQQDPGYAFRLSEGQKTLDRQAAARGGLISGGALKAAERYGQDMGSQEYTNAFNRYQTERASKLQPLQSLAGVGQSATNQLATNAGNYGGNVAGIYQQQGINAGNALLGGAQAQTSTYGDIAKSYGQTKPNWSNLFGTS